MSFLPTSAKDDDTWISTADMMAGLMMIFLFIAIIYIQNISQYFTAVNDVRDEICADLSKEFSPDLERWNMTICEGGLLVRFQNDSNFDRGSSVLSSDFEQLLDSFIPRLFGVVWKYKDSVSELRIEGHTDSTIRPSHTPLTGYIFNTKLSQDRSRNVLSYTLTLPSMVADSNYLNWAFENITAHGMSSSNLIRKDGRELYNKSRRVELRIKTKAEDALLDLVNQLNLNGS